MQKNAAGWPSPGERLARMILGQEYELGLLEEIRPIAAGNGVSQEELADAVCEAIFEKDSLNKLPEFCSASRACCWCGVFPTSDIGHYVNLEALAAIQLNSNSTGWSTVQVSGKTPPLSGKQTLKPH